MAKIGVQYPKVPYSGILVEDFNDLIEALQRGELGIVTKNVGLASVNKPGKPDGGWWKLDSDALDYSANGNDGSLVGGVTIGGSSGPSFGANATNFDGIDDEVSISGMPQMSEITISMWINPDQHRIQGLFVSDGGSSPRPRIFMSSTGGAIEFDATGEIGNLTIGIAPTGEWTHIAVTYENGIAKTYRDGVLITTASTANMLSPTSWSFNIAGVAGSRFDGQIADVRVYTKALSHELIQGLYTSELLADGFINVSQNGVVTTTDQNGNEEIISHVFFDANRDIGYRGYVYPDWHEDLGRVSYPITYGQNFKLKGRYQAISDTPLRETHERFAFGVVSHFTVGGHDPVDIYNEFANETSTARDDINATGVIVDDSENVRWWDNVQSGETNVTYTTSGATADLSAGITFEVIGTYSTGSNNWSVAFYVNGALRATRTVDSFFQPFVLCNQKSRLTNLVLEVSDA